MSHLVLAFILMNPTNCVSHAALSLNFCPPNGTADSTEAKSAAHHTSRELYIHARGVMNVLTALKCLHCSWSTCATSELASPAGSPEQGDELSSNDYSHNLFHGCSEDLTLCLHAYSLTHIDAHTRTQLLKVVFLSVVHSCSHLAGPTAKGQMGSARHLV